MNLTSHELLETVRKLDEDVTSVRSEELELLYADLTVTQASELGKKLDNVIQQFARITDYLGRRNAGQKHKHAFRGGDKRLRHVRKALGYTYP